YLCIDYIPLRGTSYYRISQTDYDGNTTILNLIAFTECAPAANSINAYNTNGVININVMANANDFYTISLINVLGQTILNENSAVTTGNNNIKLYPNVSDGIYILSVKSGKVSYTRKMFIGK
ncbi:MAG TPA: T9SS type A sorting domain-containing protein, partial [Bacteroidia bacterium]|nr:T9SS type A sorting domain-containing protein [Bacteroidia bacterium]